MADSVGRRTDRPEAFKLDTLANLGHELRTPIQVMLGYLEMLREDYRDGIGQEALAIIERMNANIHDLAETVENIMQFAQAESHTQPLVEEMMVTSELVEEIEPSLRAAMREKRAELKVDIAAAPQTIRGYRKPLRAIISNLARNAIKFTERGSVTLSIRALATGGIEIEVADTGPGMTAARLEEAFTPLVQLSGSSARRYRGMGLGLTVVRRNVEAMGGTLEVRSTAGVGSSFRVALPGPADDRAAAGDAQGAAQATEMVTTAAIRRSGRAPLSDRVAAARAYAPLHTRIGLVALKSEASTAPGTPRGSFPSR